MKTLVAYATKHGTTRKYAEAFAKQLSGPVTVVDLSRDPNPTLMEYEAVVIGGAIIAGMVPKPVKDFCAKNQATLMEKRLGLFVCCMNMSQAEATLAAAYPKELSAAATVKAAFGGEIILKNMGFAERLIVRAVGGFREDSSNYSEQPLAGFVATLEAQVQ